MYRRLLKIAFLGRLLAAGTIGAAWFMGLNMWAGYAGETWGYPMAAFWALILTISLYVLYKMWKAKLDEENSAKDADLQSRFKGPMG